MSDQDKAATLRELRKIDSAIASKMRLFYDDESKPVREALQKELASLHLRRRELVDRLAINNVVGPEHKLARDASG